MTTKNRQKIIARTVNDDKAIIFVRTRRVLVGGGGRDTAVVKFVVFSRRDGGTETTAGAARRGRPYGQEAQRRRPDIYLICVCVCVYGGARVVGGWMGGVRFY